MPYFRIRQRLQTVCVSMHIIEMNGVWFRLEKDDIYEKIYTGKMSENKKNTLQTKLVSHTKLS